VTHEWRDHTAEVELQLEAANEGTLFAEAAAAFGEYVERSSGGEPARHEVALEARDRASLLVELLEELIYLADTEGFVTDRGLLVLDGPRLTGTLEGRRTEIAPIVKAATYHDLAYERRGEAWHAHVVLDV